MDMTYSCTCPACAAVAAVHRRSCLFVAPIRFGDDARRTAVLGWCGGRHHTGGGKLPYIIKHSLPTWDGVIWWYCGGAFFVLLRWRGHCWRGL